jgi:chemotaxis protein methyltransferase CheR
MKACGIAHPAEYVEGVLRAPPGDGERRCLIGHMVVGETRFFRTPDMYRVLQEAILPSLVAAGHPFPLRLWSAGCATGQEPYSLAIAALEAFRGRFLEPVRVLATDLNTEFLETAARGVYPPSALRDVPPALVEKYFRPQDDGAFRVADEVRRLVTFEERNLASPLLSSFPPPQLSAIFCRNVMIYFRSDTTRRVVDRFYRNLEEGGIFFLGHSETLWGISEAFRLEETNGVFHYRKKEQEPKAPRGKAAKSEGRPSAAPAPPRTTAGSAARVGEEALALVLAAEKLADRDRLDEAETACREAISLWPDCVEAEYLLAVLLRRKGNGIDALAHAERACSIDGRFILAAVEIAENLLALGRRKEAAGRWGEILRLLEGEVRFPRLSPATGMTARSLREYVAARALR